MGYLLHVFQPVSLTFASLAIGTGAQATFDPINFSKSFGLALNTTSGSPQYPKEEDVVLSRSNYQQSSTKPYISLMGVRQLATGVLIFTFAYQGKWTEIATILSIIGILVAGTNDVYLSRAGLQGKGVFHALPGAFISTLACGFLFSCACRRADCQNGQER
ncbi:hypothetical protein WAI453_009088 [Rhynchosporium graminicola]